MATHSLVIPIYRNAENIPALLVALDELSNKLAGDIEVIFVIDGSPDNSGELILAAERRYTSRVIFHSRNFGSFTAIRTGLEYSRGKYVAAMAADLQEPPELILQFFELLSRDEFDVVFGQRTSRNDPSITTFLSGAYWALYRRLVLPAMPKGGVDVFGCNRNVVETILSIEEPNSSLVAQLFWAGYRRGFVSYERRPRLAGKSAWSLRRRLRYMMDSIFSYTDLPIVLLLWLGVAGCLSSLVFGLITFISWLYGAIDARGYTTIVILISFFGSLNLLVQGIVGSYLWRTFENTKKRPLRVISRIVEG